ncbi:hypothetical protein AAMO2058_000936700 [Amorphochlora amoebiformis]
MAGPPKMGERERTLARLSASAFVEMRKRGEVTCEEYAEVLVKRAKHYKYMGQFMYFDILPNQMDQVVRRARELDQKAQEEGVDSLSPLYCLPVPIKGTMATVDYPSSAGVGVLHGYFAKYDAKAVDMLKEKFGIPFGKTNVPEFAASWVACNYANGCTLNPYDHSLTAGGSSGGGASAVASYIAPIAFTEDTGGSTRHPGVQNGNFAYDPSRNHYPNQGNSGMSYTNDQIGINARTFEDILFFDQSFLSIDQHHKTAAEKAAKRPLSDIKVGLPRRPFAEIFLPEGAANGFGLPTTHQTRYRASEWNMEKLKLAEKILASAGVKLIREVNGGIMEPNFEIFHSFAGQIATFVNHYLEAKVSLREILSDLHPAGDGHNPFGLINLFTITDESKFRYTLGPYLDDMVSVWNSYFDKTGVDVIMVPAQLCDAIKFSRMANSSCTMGGGIEASLSKCNIISYSFAKSIPIPKVIVPVGLSPAGTPISIMFLGRSGPKNATDNMWRFDDEWAKTSDVDFLYTVDTLVKQIWSEAKLRRKEPSLVVGPGNSNLFLSHDGQV